MHITHIYGSVFRMHGATKWLLLFASQLAQRGHNSVIVCLNYSIPLPHWFQGTIRPLWSRQFSSLEFSGIKKLVFIAMQFITMPLLAFKIPRETDIIIYHGDYSLFTSLLAKILFRRAKHIYYCYQSPRELYDLAEVTRQTYGIWYVLLGPILALYKAFDRLLVRPMAAVLVWSKEHQLMISPIYGELDYYSVPAAVDFSVFIRDAETDGKVAALREKMGLQDKFVLLMNASLTAKKRIPMLLALLKKLSDEGYAVHGVVIGEGPEEDNLRALASDLDVTEHITFLGFVTQEEMPLYYHLCDILLYLELRGLWTMSLIEAGATGKPVITAPGGSMPTLVDHGQTGYILAGIGDADDLFEKTRNLLRDRELREKMGQNNYQHCLQFSIEQSVDGFLKGVL